MANRGTNKRKSTDHEDFVARSYEGRRSRSSGAAAHDAGDVRNEHDLIECKVTGGPEKETRTPTLIRHLEKVADEAWSEGRNPVVCMRYYLPESILANPNGWVDLTVRLLTDDIERSYAEDHST